MFNEPLFNEAMFNDTGAAFVPVIVDTIDPGVSFIISDELGGFDETGIDDTNGC